MIIDLRSDTVTRPTKGMLEAMFSAEVGDDVFEEDPTIKKLENRLAEMFGQEAGMFCPSGTMVNQIAIRLLTQPQEEIICDKNAHFYYYEAGGVASNSGVSLRLLDGNRGRINAKMVEENINDPLNYNQTRTSLISVENTSNKGGGSYYTLNHLQEIYQVVQKYNLNYHLDGARVFNAVTETGDDLKVMGKMFNTISVCLSKGLGAPVGSVLVTAKDNILKAKRIRKAMGGGMRQSGYLAAAGLYALDHNIKRLKEDHNRAKIIGEALNRCPAVAELLPVDTNIIVFRLDEKAPVKDFLDYLLQYQIKAVPFGKQTVRMVTHLDFNDDHLDILVNAIKKYN